MNKSNFAIFATMMLATAFIISCGYEYYEDGYADKIDVSSSSFFSSSSLVSSSSELSSSSSSDANILVDIRDDKEYRTVVINNQTWMAENLNYETPSGSVCHSNNPNNCGKYGRLYDWETATEACPDGWHLPSRNEWVDLITYAGGSTIAVGKLKSATELNGTDYFNFSALLGGNRGSEGSFVNMGLAGFWWTETSFYCIGMNSSEVTAREVNSSYGMSVRCIKD